MMDGDTARQGERVFKGLLSFSIRLVQVLLTARGVLLINCGQTSHMDATYCEMISRVSIHFDLAQNLSNDCSILGKRLYVL